MEKRATPETSSRDIRHLYYELGLALLERGDYQTAINNFSEALSSEGDSVKDWDINFRLGQSYASLNYRVLASEHLLYAIAESPEPATEWFTNAALVIDRSTVLLKREWLQKEFMAALEKKKLNDVTKRECRLLQAQIAIHLDDGALAAKALENLSDSAPQVIMMKGEAALLQGDNANAIRNFTRASQLYTENTDQPNADSATICLARVHAENGNYEEAFKLTSNLKNILPNYAYHVRLIDGYFFLKNQKVSDAQNCISQLRLTDNRPVEANLLECRLLLRQKEYAKAAEVATNADGSAILRQEFNYLRGRALIESNTNTDEGTKLLKQLHETGAPLQLFLKRDQCASLDSNGNYHFFRAVLLNATAGSPTEVAEAFNAAVNGEIGGGDSKLSAGIALQMLLLQQQSLNAADGDQSETCYRLGIYYYDQSQYGIAVQWLRQSLQLKSMMKTRWYLVDSLFLDSAMSESPYVDKAKIKEAETLWEQSIKLELPDTTFPWAYLLMARIMDYKSKLPGEDLYACYCKGWAYAEMATLLEPQRYLPWSFLGKFQRLLSVYNNARQSLEKGMELNPSDFYLIEDMAAVYLDTGDYEKAEPLLADLKSKSNDAFYDGWMAFSLYNRFRFEEAIPLFKRRIESNDIDFWSRNFLQSCYWLGNKQQEAREQAQWIWDNRDKAGKDRRDIVARAALTIGSFDECIRINNELLGDSDYKAAGNYELFICYLYRGELEKADSYFRELFDNGFDARQFSVASFELKHISDQSEKENWKHGAGLRKMIHDEKNGWLARIEKFVQQLNGETVSLYDELNRQLKVEHYSKEGSWGWIACQSAMARLMMQENRIHEAKEVYSRMLPHKERFCPLNSGIDFVVENFVKNFPSVKPEPGEAKK